MTIPTATDGAGSISAAIADFVQGPVDQEMVDLARARLLDAIGVALAARSSPQAQSAIAAANTLMGDGVCSALDGAEGYSPSGAALINATLIHTLDFDDTYLAGAMHTHPTVIPAALAMGDMVQASLPELIEATAIGTEVACWLSRAVGRDLQARGFHTSAIIGSLGAVAAAARLCKLSRADTVNALGLVGTVGAGTWQFEESWVKNWNVAVAAQSAIAAVAAASSGFQGPMEPIEGKYGLLATHLTTESQLADIGTLGSPWLSPEISMKRYGCCHFLQSVVSGTLEAAESTPAREISAVTVKVPSELAMRCVAEPIEARKAPENTYRARFAGHWLVARGLLDGDVNLRTFDDVQIEGSVAEMTDRITFEIADFPGYPNVWPAEIALTTKDGSTRTVRHDGEAVTFAKSNASALQEKFCQNIAYSGLDSTLAQNIIEILQSTNAMVAALWKLISHDDTSPPPAAT